MARTVAEAMDARTPCSVTPLRTQWKQANRQAVAHKGRLHTTPFESAHRAGEYIEATTSTRARVAPMTDRNQAFHANYRTRSRSLLELSVTAPAPGLRLRSASTSLVTNSPDPEVVTAVLSEHSGYTGKLPAT